MVYRMTSTQGYFLQMGEDEGHTKGFGLEQGLLHVFRVLKAEFSVVSAILSHYMHVPLRQGRGLLLS